MELPKTEPRTLEEAAREWFREKTGMALPEEFKSWLRQLAHDEAVRVTTSTSVLSPTQIMKLHEAKRLAATKLENVEKSIDTVRRKQDWIDRFNDIKIRLQENQTTLYEAGKQYAALRDARTELSRYESFESIQGLYNRYLTLQGELQMVRSEASVLKRQCAEAEAVATQAQARADKADKLYQDAETQLRNTMDMLSDGFKMDGTLETLEWSNAFVNEWHKSAQGNLDTIRRKLAALESEAAAKETALADTQARLQALEPHAAMLKAGGAIMVKLDQLHDIEQEREELRRRADQTAARQRDLDDRLARLFDQDQALVAALSTLQAEVQMHRQSNLGIDGAKLQARTMELKVRRLHLQMARQLWANICSLYNEIDERRQTLDRERLHLEQDEVTIDRLTSELRQLAQSAEQRRYAYTVSKSQNVIKLRGDLREGTPCSVCGAMNHPYHSDTMTEQNRLMSEWKTEAEMLDAELRNKEQQLDVLRTRHAAEQGQYATEQEFLRVAQEKYRNLTREWDQYADLDRSLHDCNPAVGAGARSAMLGQLIENTDKQATETQQELDTYNYHQMAINRAAEQIDEKENRRADLASALNETNTGCQVVAGGVERIKKRIVSLTATYTALFSELGRMITLSDWASRWHAGHENFKLDLRRRMEEYEKLQGEVSRQAAALEVLSARIDKERQAVAVQETMTLTLQRQLELTATRQKGTSNAYARLFGNERATETYTRMLKQVGEAAAECITRRNELNVARANHSLLTGKADAAASSTMRLEEQVSDLHGKLDEWIRNFNTSHPPVQYAELERVLMEGREWGSLRQDIRQTERTYMLAQARDEDLRSSVLALQADDNRAMDSKGETIEALISQRENLECRRRDIMQEIADIDQQLARHEHALKQLDALGGYEARKP